MSAWRARAWEIINEVDRDLPATATLKERVAALNALAWHVHQNTSWGKKVWQRAKKTYLARHGLKPRRVASAALPLFPEANHVG